ncbi:hypothetical protein HZC20_00915 [Candidatus Peregrinibacteria bacterium]|nr:hypothetical protein [Candidatus Peregrinibacteria bacterium]
MRQAESSRHESNQPPKTPNGTRSQIASSALAVLALTTAFAAVDCKSTHRDRTAGQSFIEIKDNPEATKALEELRQRFEEEIKKTGFHIGKVRPILVERDALLMQHNVPPATEKWLRRTGEGNGPTLDIEIDKSACATSPNCVIVGTDDKGQRTREIPFDKKAPKQPSILDSLQVPTPAYIPRTQPPKPKHTPSYPPSIQESKRPP